MEMLASLVASCCGGGRILTRGHVRAVPLQGILLIPTEFPRSYSFSSRHIITPHDLYSQKRPLPFILSSSHGPTSTLKRNKLHFSRNILHFYLSYSNRRTRSG